MRIAFVSFEYPPDTSGGGIATYVYQAARMMHDRGHHVEVFAASYERSGTEIEHGVVVHRILQKKQRNRRNFSKEILPIFAARHQEIGFDVLEGPEADAHTRVVIQAFPELPLVIKLHTPNVFVQKINYVKPSVSRQVRWYLGAVRRGKLPQRYPRFEYDFDNDIERLHTLEADEITSPSQALRDELVKFWHLPEHKAVTLPNPYIPSQTLLDIPVETSTNVVTFTGRLEIRKGILDLTEAIPQILKHCPEAKFQFVGSPCPSPSFNLNTQQYMEKKLYRYRNALEFFGKVPLGMIPSFLGKSDVCVYPSRWENFPNVCLEAMAAARGVVGSSAGGMAEMLDQGQVGRLVPPRNPNAIAEAVVELLKNPELRMQLGQAARERVLAEYNLERIGALQEASYQRAVARRQAAGPRTAFAASEVTTSPHIAS